MRPLLHQLHDVAAVHLDDVVHVDVRQARRHQHLDHEFVPGRFRQVRWRPQPSRELFLTEFGDAVVLLTLVFFDVVRMGQPVAFEPLERRVDLADVERPHLAGARLELLA